MVFEIVRLDNNPLKGVNEKYSPLFDKDIPRLNQYLKSRYSPRNQRYVRNRLIHFNEWMRARFGVENILQINFEQVETYFNEVINTRIKPNGEPIKLVTKNKWRTQLRGYYKYVGKLKAIMDDRSFHAIFKIKKDELINPVPDADIYRFDKEELTLSKIKERKKKITYEIGLKLLNYYYYNWFEMFILVGLCAWSGPRIEEVVSITLPNIDLENSFFFNILKKTKKEDTYGIYFFPEWFVKFLQLQIKQKNLKYPEEAFLFPSPRITGQYISQGQIRKRIHETCKLLGIDVVVTPHRFRGLLNKERKKYGVEPEDRSILLNHGLDSTQAKHYILDYEDFNEIKEIYDKCFPYPKFEPNPNYLEPNYLELNNKS